MRAFLEWLLGADTKPRPVVAPSTLPALTGQRELSLPIKVTDVREDAPEFRRDYESVIVRGIKVKISVRRGFFRGSYYKSGELTQPNGKWVLFDPEDVADKILDPEILGEVERVCSDIIAMDNAWRSEPKRAFVDKNGQQWVAAPLPSRSGGER
jgi:hypothetical protein